MDSLVLIVLTLCLMENHHVVSRVQMDRLVLMLTLYLMAGAMSVENHHVVSCVQMDRLVLMLT